MGLIDAPIDAVHGLLDISSNPITSLEGCPTTIEGQFICVDTNITNLIGAPKSVQNGMTLGRLINLTSLEGCPELTGGFILFNCYSLTSLEHLNFNGTDNLEITSCGLTSLVGCPNSVDDDFICELCSHIESLDGMPTRVYGDVSFQQNGKKFTEEDIQYACNVRGAINV